MTQNQTMERTILIPAGQSRSEIAEGHDVRGMTVWSSDQQELGTVDDLLLDQMSGDVRFLRVKGGGFLGVGDRTWLVPVDAIEDVSDDGVRLSKAGTDIQGAPSHERDHDADQEADYEGVYAHYGYSPYWSAGYAYPRWGLRRRA